MKLKYLYPPLFALSLLPMPGMAQNMASDLMDVVRFELLPGWRQENGRHMVAVRVTLQDGWNTYWRIRGSSGIPPRFSAKGSENSAATRILWPSPDVLDIHGDMVIGYINEVVLPVEITPIQDGQDIKLHATLDLGVCSDMCIPVTAEFDAILPNTQIKADAEIIAALNKVPSLQSGAQVGRATCQLSPIDDGVHLVALIDTPPLRRGVEIAVVEVPNPDVWVPLPVTQRQGDMLRLTVDMINYAGGAFMPDMSDIRITILGEDQSLDIQGCAPSSG